jgi:predicted nucleic acid-binding protein
MVLVDTSVWISHFREGNENLERLLMNGEVLFHPFIVGELACGNLKNRAEILSLLMLLPSTILMEDEEVLHFIERNDLAGKGIGYIDIHLAASAVLSGIRMGTLDQSLANVNRRFLIDY